MAGTDVPCELNPPIRILMGPGPSDIHPRVLQAIGKGTIGHLDPYYLQLMDQLQEMLRQVFRTKNEMTFAVSATGSADEAIAIDADCILYSPLMGQRPEVVRMLEAGRNVVTPLDYFYPLKTFYRILL